MTTKNTKKKKQNKYHYYLDFKRGDYFEITRGIEKKYPSAFYGCGIGFGGIDVHLYCTPRKFQLIKAFVARNYPKFKVTRYTEEELYPFRSERD